MANPLDKTLEALQNIQDAIDTIKTRKTVISEKRVLQDYDKIISYLEGAIADLDEAIDLLKLEMTISDSDKNEELQKIISLLGGASKSLVESITVFGKYVNL